MSSAPVVPTDIRIAQSALSDSELAYILDLIALSRTIRDDVPGWSVTAAINMDRTFESAAKIRGINNGVRVISQTVELRS